MNLPQRLAHSYPWLLVAGALFLIAFTFFIQSAVQSFIETGPAAISYWRFFLVEPIGWLLWAGLLPLILLTYKYFPVEWNSRWKIYLPVQAVAAILFSVCHLYLHLIGEALVLDSWPLSFYSVELKLNFFTFLQLTEQILSYSIILVLVAGVNHYRKYKKLELEAAELERLIKEGMLENMMEELGPEFLLGTFRSISEKIDQNVVVADHLIAKLGNFLRILLQNNGERMVPLAVELELLKNYFEIQKIRSGRRTNLKIWTGPETLSCLIPKLILFSIGETIVREHVCNEEVASEVLVKTCCTSDALDVQVSVTLASGIRNRENISAIAGRLSEPYPEAFRSEMYPNGCTFTLFFVLPRIREEPDKDRMKLEASESILRHPLPSLDQSRNRLQIIQNSSSRWSNAYLHWVLIFLIYNLVASRFYIRAAILNTDVGWHTIFGWYAWALITPVVLRSFRMISTPSFSWRRASSLLMLTVLCWMGMTSLISLCFPAGWNSSFLEILVLRGINGSGFAFDFLAYVVLIGINFIRTYSEKLHQTELRTLHLEVQLAEARLRVLRMQLHPHFLFNALHSLSELMYEDSNLAKGMIKNLEKFFGVAVANSGKHELTLEMELDLLKSYLEIQQMRFHDRLVVDIRLAEDTLQDRVPYLILQPIIENAVKHGLSEKVEAGRLEIRSHHINGMLLLEVKDNGPGMAPAQLWKFKEGLGLANTRARLNQHYGKNYRLDLGNAPDGGLIVAISLPIITKNLLKVS